MATTIVRPNGDSSVAFSPLGAGTNHSEVSEVSPDGDSSYNTSSDATETDLDMFTFANASIPSGDVISSVILTVRARDTGGGQAQLSLRTSHDALYESAAANLGTSYADITDDVTADETWLPADFDGQGITIGYRVMGNSSSRERRVTQVFLTIIHAAPADILQAKFQFYADDGSESGSTALAGISVNAEIAAGELDDIFHVRFQMANDGGSLLEDDWQVEFQLNGTGGFSDMNASSGAVRSILSDGHVDEFDVTTDRLSGTQTFVAGGVDETDGRENNFALDADERTEDVYVFTPRSAVMGAGDFVDMRIKVVGGEGVTYTVTARLSIAAAGGIVVERTVTDKILIPDRTYKLSELTLQDSILAPDQELDGSIRGTHITEGLFLDDSTVHGIIRSQLVREGLFLTDRMTSETDKIITEGLLLADSASRVLELLSRTGLLLGDSTTAQLLLVRTVVDGLFMIDRAVRLQESTLRDGVLTPDQIQRESQIFITPDGLLIGDSTEAQRIAQRSERDGLEVPDRVSQEQHKVLREGVLLADAAFRELLTSIRDSVLLGDHTVRETHVSALDGLMINDLMTKAIEIFSREGLLLGDSVTTQIFLENVGSLIGVILLGLTDPMGVDLRANDPVGIVLGSGDPLGVELAVSEIGGS